MDMVCTPQVFGPARALSADLVGGRADHVKNRAWSENFSNHFRSLLFVDTPPIRHISTSLCRPELELYSGVLECFFEHLCTPVGGSKQQQWPTALGHNEFQGKGFTLIFTRHFQTTQSVSDSSPCNATCFVHTTIVCCRRWMLHTDGMHRVASCIAGWVVAPPY